MAVGTVSLIIFIARGVIASLAMFIERSVDLLLYKLQKDTFKLNLFIKTILNR